MVALKKLGKQVLVGSGNRIRQKKHKQKRMVLPRAVLLRTQSLPMPVAHQWQRAGGSQELACGRVIDFCIYLGNRVVSSKEKK